MQDAVSLQQSVSKLGGKIERFAALSFITHNRLRLSLYTRAPSEIYETLTGMTTDVYPRENCIAPAIVFNIVWTTDTKNGRGLAPDCVPI